MVAFDGSELCGRAEEYYHDFLEDENSRAVPQVVAEHIRQCDRCQRRLNRLRESLCAVESGGPSLQSQQDKGLIGTLQSHFELLGERLNCGRVKAFLPGLLVPSLKVRIPTPVTVHVDQCPACAADLESLRALGLEAEQLARLSRLYADSAGSGFWACVRTQSRFSMGWSGSLDRMDAETLNHLCVCPRCRNRLYQLRQRRLDRERRDLVGQEGIRCSDIAPADVFDCVVPYGGRGRSGENAGERKCRGHLRFSPHCLEKAQQLHRTVYGILERPDSSVVTVCTTRSDAGVVAEEVESVYEGYAIDVQVLRREPQRVVGAAFGPRVSARLRPIFKPALMAAAVIPLAIIFFLSSPEASGLNPAQVNRMVCEAPNVHVLVFGEDMAAPKQELWASKGERLLISETAGKSVVFELALGRVSVVRRVEGVGGLVQTGPVEGASAERHMDSLLGLSLDTPLREAEMEPVADLTEAGTRFEVYELQWQLSTVGGSLRPHRWRVYVDSATRRPGKAEFFTWDPLEEVWVLDETRRFEYPDEEAVRRHADALLALD